MAIYTETIKIDPRNFDVAEEFMRDAPKKIKTAIRFTLIDTMNFGEAEIYRQVLGRYDITRSSLLDQGRRARARVVKKLPSAEDLQAELKIESNRFPVMRFNVIPQTVPPQRGIPVARRQPVSIITVRGRAQVGAPNRFIARMQSGHTGVFMRKPDAKHRMRPDGQRTQLNISEEHMISLAEMVRSKYIRPVLDQKMFDYFQKRYTHHTKSGWLK